MQSMLLLVFTSKAGLREFVQTTVILTPGVGTPGSVPHRMLRFRWIRWIRFRVPRGHKMEDSTMMLALFAGIGDLFLALNP